MSSNILKLPCRKNEKLNTLVQKISGDVKLQTYWKCANTMAIDRMGYTDHGPIHIKIVANSALKILRILIQYGVVPNIVKDYGMTNDDAEIIVVLAATLHDLGMAVVRETHRSALCGQHTHDRLPDRTGSAGHKRSFLARHS